MSKTPLTDLHEFQSDLIPNILVVNTDFAGELEEKLNRAMEVVKAVAHIGIDWGYGEYQLSKSDIDKARSLYEEMNNISTKTTREI